MRTFRTSFLAVFSISMALSATALAQTRCPLKVRVDGFRSRKGALGIALFKSADGWPESKTKSYFHNGYPITGVTTTVTLQVPPGAYGVVVLDDENSNEKLDRNFLGIPKEGFGFANNPHVGLSAPSFDKAVVHVTCPATETTIHLIYK
jgi:uncharacterized protein (DUF2141 family)